MLFFSLGGVTAPSRRRGVVRRWWPPRWGWCTARWRRCPRPSWWRRSCALLWRLFPPSPCRLWLWRCAPEPWKRERGGGGGSSSKNMHEWEQESACNPPVRIDLAACTEQATAHVNNTQRPHTRLSPARPRLVSSAQVIASWAGPQDKIHSVGLHWRCCGYVTGSTGCK